MKSTQTIVSQFNQANQDLDLLKELQSEYLIHGEDVIEINDQQFIIQKRPELFYKLIELTNLKHELKTIINDTPETLLNVTTIRMMEIEIKQTCKLSNIKLDSNAIKKIIVGNSSKHFKDRNIVEAFNRLQHEPLVVENSLQLMKLYTDQLIERISKSNLKHLGAAFRKDQHIDPVAKNYRKIKGLAVEDNIYSAINQILDYLNNSQENIFIKTAIFSYLFEYIQPFGSYNGYIARYIASGYLFDEIDIASYALSNTFVQNRGDYYQLLNETADEMNVNDLTAYVYTFIEYTIDSINYIKKFLQGNVIRIKNFSNKLATLDLTNNQKLCLEILHQAYLVNEPLTTNQVVSQSGLSNPTALKCMSKLEALDIATIEKPGKVKIIKLNAAWIRKL